MPNDPILSAWLQRSNALLSNLIEKGGVSYGLCGESITDLADPKQYQSLQQDYAVFNHQQRKKLTSDLKGLIRQSWLVRMYISDCDAYCSKAGLDR